MIDCLISNRTPSHAVELMQAVCASAKGFDSRLVRAKPRKGAVLVLYGLGGPDRIQYASWPKLVAFDLGYWERYPVGSRKYRVSINGFHCPDLIMRGERPSSERFEQAGLTITDHGGDSNGPVMLVGNAPKSIAVGAQGWTAEKSRMLKAAGYRIVYRPKPGRPHEPDVQHDGVSDGPITEELSKVSMVVCRHSNVAIDACLQGVPVVCESGAAAAIYPNEL